MANEKFITVNGKLLNKVLCGTLYQVPKRIGTFNGSTVIPYIKDDTHAVTYTKGSKVDTLSGPAVVHESNLQFTATGSWVPTGEQFENITGSATNCFYDFIKGDNNTFSFICYPKDNDGPITIEAHSYTCLLQGTKVLLADGSTKNIEDIEYTDLLLSFDPFIGQFVGQYPTWICKGNPNCVEHGIDLITEDNEVLHICTAHNVYNNYTKRFVNITWDNAENVDYSNFALAKYINGKLVSRKLKAVNNISYPRTTIAYSIYMPMGGNVVTDGFLTSGNFMFTEFSEDLLKEHQCTDVYSEPFKNFMSSHCLDEDNFDEDASYIQDKMNHCLKSDRIFYCSGLKYMKAFCEQYDIKTATPEGWQKLQYVIEDYTNHEKAYPVDCQILIENTVYYYRYGDWFTFPKLDNIDAYFDLSTYNLYNPGDTMKVICSTNILGLVKSSGQSEYNS